MKTVILIEDHSIVRVGIKSILDKSGLYHVIASYETGADGLKAVKEKKPDYVIIDLNLPDIQGEVIVKDLFMEQISSKVIVLTRQKYIPQISHLLTLGISGYILKDHASKELLPAFKEAEECKTYISPAIKELLVKVGHVSIDSENGSDLMAEALTQRELQVIRILCQGYDYKQISAKLGISPSTVRVHIRNILAKLKLKDSKEIIKLKDSIL